MKVVLDTQVLEDAELRAITKYRTAGKSRRKATRAEVKQFLQQVIDEAVTVTLAGPPQVSPTVGSVGPGPDGDVLAEVDVVVEGDSEDEILTALDQIKTNISEGEKYLTAAEVFDLLPGVLAQAEKVKTEVAIEGDPSTTDKFAEILAEFQKHQEDRLR